MEENKELNEEVKETEESNTGLESGGSNPELESGLESDVETIEVKLQNEIDELNIK